MKIDRFAVLKGRLTFFLNEEEYPLEAGGLIIINSNEIHSIHAPRKNYIDRKSAIHQWSDCGTGKRG